MRDITLNLVPKPVRVVFAGTGSCSPDARIYRENVSLPGGAEAYFLELSPSKIVMRGEAPGLFYAERTLEQLRVQFPGEIPCIRIEDAPRFPQRGFMLDSVRHFFSEPDVMTLIDAAAFFKLNRFHWHLADDQGWRIESRRYPRLHEIGSVRSGGESSRGNGETGTGGAGDTEYRGFYTKTQIRRLLRFAAERNVAVIPGIGIPGHATAAVAAYPELGCTGFSIPVAAGGGIFENLICAGREECFDFLMDVLDEITELFSAKEIHIGGNAEIKSQWRACPYCRQRMAELGLFDEDALQSWYVGRVGACLRARGMRPVIWNEALRGGAFSPKQFIVQLCSGGQEELAEFAGRGGEIINSDISFCHLNRPHGDFDAWEVLRRGPVPDFLNEEQAKQVKGLEGLLWTENIPDLETAGQLLYPSLPALAETAWTLESSRDNDSFFARYEGCTALSRRRYPRSAGDPGLAAHG
ncbi:beta-N-acetylhexosaminidase [Lachnoclostridium sp. Marseille-P6806]|uniref:beta-N-acetylhexosaminidase n=1 Tax=Lachnoclostridium sp. Marseille-P6806 TaxID=2364793 RepID=UPI0010321060|nr:beta-N-acetylhexosaminidase [Lachnoclostridium sp. Marseille-P6806]